MHNLRRPQRASRGRRREDSDPLIRRSSLYGLFDQAPAVIAVLRGPDLVFELVNPSYQKLFGGRSLLGRPIREALPEIEGQGFFELLEGVYSTGQSHVAREARIMIDRTGDGELEEAFFNFIYQPMYAETGAVEGIIVFAFDVTEEARARKQGEEQLRESEEIFRLLVDSVHDYAIFMLDVEGRIVSWNEGGRRIHGYHTQEIVGRHVSALHPDGEEIERELHQARDQGRVEEEGWRLRKDGSQFRADAVMTAVHDAEGNLRGFAAVTRDVTERRHSEETARALAVAQEINGAKDEFLAVVSHELRTPLTSILGWARMLRMGGLSEEMTEEALDALERSAQAQVHLIEDLLDDTRITSGKLRLNKRPLQIRSIVETAIADVAPAADARGVRLVSTLGCQECPVFGDPIRLQQVIWNLLSNAIKFTPEGGSVFVDVKRMDDRAVLTIRDTGMGMEAGLIRKLFQRFRQGESSSDRKGGLGLGLAISRYLVEQHDGRIEGASDGKGKGSTFAIDLPISTEVPDEFKSRDTNRADDLPDLAGVRVLLVEDQVDNRDMLVTVLRRCGADVKFGASAEEGWETLRDWDPAVIVCDIALPGADGCEFLKNVRLGAMIPALALTVFGSAEEEARVRACGFNTFRQKPIEPADLAHEVARLAAIARTSGSPA